jgi:hypothetical protein
VKQVLPLVLELAAAGLLIYAESDSKGQILAAFWHFVMRSCQTAARKLGEFGMSAEVRYYDVVRA